MKKPSAFVVFLTVFIDLIGFGIVLPLLPIYSRDFGAGGFLIGLIMASYSVMQFLCSPGWGRLSDQIGRRPVLLISITGSVISYALFAFGSSIRDGSTALAIMLASRIFAGIFGANITVAQAFIADITPPEKRSQRMGLIGVAFGLGFIFGPAIGGLGLKYFGLPGPGWLATGLCGLNLLFALFKLPETRPTVADAAKPSRATPRWHHVGEVLRRPQVGLLVVVFFLATFIFACFETTLGLLVSKTFSLDPTRESDTAKVVYLYTFCGLIGALVQGGAIGHLVRRMGEPRIIRFSLYLLAMGLAPLPFVGTWPTLLAALTILSLGTSLTRPPLFGLLSNLTSADQQGVTLGVAQSAGSLARILGPVFAGVLFGWHPGVLYLLCSALALATGLVVSNGLCAQPGRSNAAPSPANAA